MYYCFHFTHIYILEKIYIYLFYLRGETYMYKVSLLDKISFLLVIIGAINWGLLGILNFNLVHFLLGFLPVLARMVYILVGLAGINLIRFLYCLRK